jgi:hypothetical protein
MPDAKDPRVWPHKLAADADLLVVVGEVDVRGMAAHLLCGDRVWPAVGIASMVDGDGLVADPSGVRLRLGAGPRIYVVAGREELQLLRGLLGGGLFLAAGGARVWWPGMTLRSDPRDHPFVSRIDDEQEPEMLAQIARSFDLSRPAVRREITVIEELRAMLEHELAEERRENRDLELERQQALQRAETAEALITVLTGQLEQQIASAERGPDEQ